MLAKFLNLEKERVKTGRKGNVSSGVDGEDVIISPVAVTALHAILVRKDLLVWAMLLQKACTAQTA